MLGNVIDHRNDRTCPEIDAVFEPSGHDNAQWPDGTFYFEMADVETASNGFHVTELYNTTIRVAVLRAEREWTFAVTVYLYDKGRRPLG
ncbi:hypothetical protein [Methylobacterium sp. WL116]|uniref:hypothetical protein n=1 Tax=Methylobacterium sp. WL116 TaxID=2603889 RepID=UPI0011C84C26|nr:hypothetical protein [Methylobacterium sp. WL116]TXM95363.1 hypothetical protein FV223_01010 [Methylobacterium sp. WL116]